MPWTNPCDAEPPSFQRQEHREPVRALLHVELALDLESPCYDFHVVVVVRLPSMASAKQGRSCLLRDAETPRQRVRARLFLLDGNMLYDGGGGGLKGSRR